MASHTVASGNSPLVSSALQHDNTVTIVRHVSSNLNEFLYHAGQMSMALY